VNATYEQLSKQKQMQTCHQSLKLVKLGSLERSTKVLRRKNSEINARDRIIVNATADVIRALDLQVVG
jgi:hypothetical protein